MWRVWRESQAGGWESGWILLIWTKGGKRIQGIVVKIRQYKKPGRPLLILLSDLNYPQQRVLDSLLQFLSALWSFKPFFSSVSCPLIKKPLTTSPAYIPTHLYFIFFNLYQQEIVLSPELVVSVSHLVSSEFRHQDFNNSDEYEEVNLK